MNDLSIVTRSCVPVVAVCSVLSGEGQLISEEYPLWICDAQCYSVGAVWGIIKFVEI